MERLTINILFWLQILGRLLTLPPVLVSIAIVFSLLRFFQPATHLSFSGSYQAFAHLFVGMLFGGYFASGEKHLLWIALGLTALEVFAAVFTRLI